MATVIDIKKIKVIIHTNDPKNRKIDLKGTIFGLEDTFPFYSNSVLYSEEALNELVGYDPNEKRKIFFNIDLFQTFLEQSGRKLGDQSNAQNCNVKIMLDNIFKMWYPVPKSVSLASNTDPYDCPIEKIDWVVSNFRGLIQKIPYTHISSNGKKYTVIDTKWANTIKTNPDYAVGIVQAFGIYQIEKHKFVDENNKKIDGIVSKISNKYDVSTGFSVNGGEIFKTYTKSSEKSELGRGINTLISLVEKLQEDFIFYTYLWILFIIGKSNNFEGILYEKPQTPISSTPRGNMSTTSIVYYPEIFFKEPINQLIETPILKDGDNYKLFKPIIQQTFLSSNENYIDDQTQQAIIDGLKQRNEILGVEPYKENLEKFIDFFNRFLKESSHISGNNDKNRKKLLELKTKSISDVIFFLKSIQSGTFITGANSIQAIDFSKILPIYGFGSVGKKDGLLDKILKIHSAINTFTSFNSNTISTLPMNDIKILKTNFDTNIKEVNELLEKNNQINIKDLLGLLDEIIQTKLLIEASNTVETTLYQSKKSEEEQRVWNELYSKRPWYKNFSRKVLEITQSQRSTNANINDVLGNGSRINIDELKNIIDSDAEAGISEINLRESDNVLAYQINIFCVLVGGEINEANRRKIRCPYTSEKLGSMLNRLMLNQPLNTDLRRTDFIDLTSTIKKAEQQALKKEALKNKTQKNMKQNNGIQDLVEKTGYKNYNDKEILNMGQAFLKQAQVQNIKPEVPDKKKAEDTKHKLSEGVKEFISTNLKDISDYSNTILSKSTTFDKDKIFKSADNIIGYITKEQSKTIPVLNEAYEIIEDQNPDETKKNKNIQQLNKFVSAYELLIKNAMTNTKSQEYMYNDSKKQKNYLDLYHATIMKNLFDTILERGETTPFDGAPLERQLSLGGGSRKRTNKKTIRKTRSLRQNRF